MSLLTGMQLLYIKVSGSEWDKVLIIEENFPFDKEEHKKWLYTAVTRGAQKIVLVRP